MNIDADAKPGDSIDFEAMSHQLDSGSSDDDSTVRNVRQLTDARRAQAIRDADTKDSMCTSTEIRLQAAAGEILSGTQENESSKDHSDEILFGDKALSECSPCKEAAPLTAMERKVLDNAIDEVLEQSEQNMTDLYESTDCVLSKCHTVLVCWIAIFTIDSVSFTHGLPLFCVISPLTG